MLRYTIDKHLFHDRAKEVLLKPFVQPLVRLQFCSSRSWMTRNHVHQQNPSSSNKTYTTQYHRNRTNLAHGSQPLRPTARLRFTGNGLPFPYFPWAKQVAEYRAVAAPILKPPTPSLTAVINGDWRTKDYQYSTMFTVKKLVGFFSAGSPN